MALAEREFESLRGWKRACVWISFLHCRLCRRCDVYGATEWRNSRQRHRVRDNPLKTPLLMAYWWNERKIYLSVPKDNWSNDNIIYCFGALSNFPRKFEICRLIFVRMLCHCHCDCRRYICRLHSVRSSIFTRKCVHTAACTLLCLLHLYLTI